jgi:hypothetical protein
MRTVLENDSGKMKVTKVVTTTTRSHTKKRITNGNEGREAGARSAWVRALTWEVESDFIGFLI